MAKAQVSNSQADSKSTCTAEDDDDRSNEQQRWPPMMMMAQSWCFAWAASEAALDDKPSK